MGNQGHLGNRTNFLTLTERKIMNLYLILFTDSRSTWSKETRAFFNDLCVNVFNHPNLSHKVVDGQMKRVLDLT